LPTISGANTANCATLVARVTVFLAKSPRFASVSRRRPFLRFSGITLFTVIFGTMGAFAQSSPATAGQLANNPPVTRKLPLPADPTRLLPTSSVGIPFSLEPLFALGTTDIKFQLPALMATLSDNRHEGWVLFAYPDPKTGRPLIGAGFSLDLEARDHPQTDTLNPHMFLEPSSAQLWQAAGLDPERLQRILGQYDRNLQKWGKKNYRKKIKKQQLPPEVTDEEAASLVRISAVQAIYNARAYCRGFDELTGSQQMAIAQLVYQMGVNLEEFSTFLTLINAKPQLQNASLSTTSPVSDREYWTVVQLSLIQSQWARKYSTRAISVIAMLDPDYVENRRAAEQQVKAVLKPARHKHKHQKSKSAKVKST
jgi:hypothetical protein